MKAAIVRVKLKYPYRHDKILCFIYKEDINVELSKAGYAPSICDILIDKEINDYLIR